MSLAPPEARGPLRRERLRTARLYFVCEAMPGGREPEALLSAALGGGADIVQLREKQLGREEIVRSAWTFRRLCDTHSALFVVNDDPWLAKSVGADGVHLGQDAIVGLSTHSEAELEASAERPVDYVSVGPVWETPTKPGRPGTGLAYIEHAAAHSPHPFFATGGIDPARREEGMRGVGGGVLDVGEAGARAPGFGRRLPNGADADVIHGSLGGGLQLRLGVGGEADDRVRAEDLARLLDRHVVLAEVDAVGADALRQPGIVVDDEQGRVGVAEAAEGPGRAHDLVAAELLLAQLHDVGAAAERRAQQRFRLAAAGHRLADEVEPRGTQPLAAQRSSCLRGCQAHRSRLWLDGTASGVAWELNGSPWRLRAEAERVASRPPTV